MGFEKFGMVDSTSEARAGRFVDYLEEGKVMATRCRDCGKRYLPPRTECSKCLSVDMEWFEIEPEGRLTTYTTVRYGPAGFEDKAPYTIAVAEFGEGLRMLGHLGGDLRESDIRIGMRVRITPVKLEGDRVGYEFQVL